MNQERQMLELRCALSDIRETVDDYVGGDIEYLKNIIRTHCEYALRATA